MAEYNPGESLGFFMPELGNTKYTLYIRGIYYTNMPKDKTTKTLNVTFSQESHRRLRHLAADADMSLKSYIEQLMAEELEKRWKD